MNCEEFRKLLDNYELLSEEQLRELENHTAECESCRKELEFFRSIISISGSIPTPKAPESLIENVNKKLDEQSAPMVIFAKFKSNIRIFSTVAACLAVGLAVGINNSYIKEHIGESDNTDGVIRETVVTPSETEKPQMPKATEKTESKPVADKAEAPTEIAKASAQPEVTPTVLQVTTAPEATPVAQTPKPEPTPKSSNEPKKEVRATQTPSTPTPEPTEEADVNDYAISEKTPIAYGCYNVEPVGRSSNVFADYLHVGSEDMGAVVSTMSEMGFKKSGEYYMTSRENFYEFVNILSDKGVGYDCDLSYNSGDDIAFKLIYN